MLDLLIGIHLLAAAVWVGGSTALVFVGVPAIRTVDDITARGGALKELGLRWRPLGYSSLVVAAVTGVALAGREWEHRPAFEIVFWVKVVLALGLIAASYVHNFVLGPRLQAEVRDGLEQVSRRPLVLVGWVSYTLTLSVPALGYVLDRLVG